MSNINTPALGLAIARFVEAGKTEGGLHLPVSSHETEATWYLVKASKGYIDAGALVEHDMQPGDRIYLRGHLVEERDPRNTKNVKVARLRALSTPMLAPDERLVYLVDIIMWQRPEQARH